LSEDSPAQLAEFRVGSVLAGYRLERELGTGGMAVVFRARDERLGRPVALKILSPELASDSAFRRRFIAEAPAAAAVDDPHIIPVYDAGEAGGVLFIAMRYVAGGDLRQVLEREDALPPDRAADVVSQVASALDAAHGAGLVHRDVKPGNILVDTRPGRPDHVYLSDFGIVRRAASERLTQVGTNVGTPAYMAPEQITGQDVDGRADQYSLACVTVQLLTGEVPFERDQLPALMYAHLSAPPPSLVSRRPDLPAAVDQVVAKAMAKAPDSRYDSCGDFADALREALGLPSYHRRGPATGPPTPPPSGILETPVPAVPDYPGTVTAEPVRLAATADVPAVAPDLLTPSPVDKDAGTASPETPAVTDDERPGDLGTAVPSDEAAPPRADILVAGPPDPALADPQSSGTVPSEILPPAETPPPKAPAAQTPPPKAPPPEAPPAETPPPVAPPAETPPPVAPPAETPPPEARPAASTTTPVPVGDALPAAAAVPADYQRAPSWIRRHRLPVFALACAALAAAITLLLISPSHPSSASSSNSLSPSNSPSPSTSPHPLLTGTGWISLGNLSATPSPADLYLYSSTSPSPQVVHDVPYGTILPYQPVHAGEYSVEVRNAGASAKSNPVWSVSLTVKAGGKYSVVPLRATNQRGQLMVIDNNLTTPAGKSYVRVIQADANQGHVTFHCSCAAGTQGDITANATPGTVSKTAAIPAGTWTMTATGPSAMTSLPVTLTAGSVHTEIVIAAPGGGIEIINLVDGVPSFTRVPVNLPPSSRHVPITSVAFSPSSTTLAIASAPMCLWDIATKVCASGFGGTGGYSLAFSPDGKTLAAGYITGKTYLWNVSTGSRGAPLTDPNSGSGGVLSVTFSPDGKILAVGDSNGHTYLWDVATEKLIGNLPDPDGKEVNSVAFSPDGKIVATGGSTGTYLWDVATRKVIAPLPDAGSKGVLSVAFSPDGKILVAGDGNGRTYLWNVATATLIAPLADPGGTSVSSVACSADDTTMAAGDNNGNTYVWNVITRTLIAKLTNPNNQAIDSVTFNANGTALAAGDMNADVSLWYISLSP
jgi:WD40 repeat protein